MDELKVWAYTTPPVANAGPDQVVVKSDTVRLDGSASLEYDGEPLTYAWQFTATPTGSMASLSGPNTANPSFVADQPGSYTVQLVVSDGHVTSTADSITVFAQSTVQALGALDKMIGNLVARDVINTGKGNALSIKLAQAIAKLPAKPTVAINLLHAFINQVEDFAAQGVLSAAQAAPLLDLADRIVASLANP